MGTTKLSPDGHAVAFLSPVGGFFQVFLMLTSGGEPLQLTNDENDKRVWCFSPDGKEVYYGRFLGGGAVWAVPALGGRPRRVLSVSAHSVVPSLDGASIFYARDDRSEIFRVEKSGLNEQLVYKPEDTSWHFEPLLLFPGGNDLLAVSRLADLPTARFYRINLTSHEAVDLGEVYSVFSDVAWADQGNSVLFSRMVNRLINIWKYSLKDRSLTQFTFGPGPDTYPMPDPGGRGIYFVNTKFSGFMTVYHVNSKESTDIVSEDVGYPAISPDGKRVMYVTSPGLPGSELWASNIDGSNKAKIATGDVLDTGASAPDNFHLSFTDSDTDPAKVYIASADGSSLRQAPPMGFESASYMETMEFCGAARPSKVLKGIQWNP
jgi:Tol biopolymer transport system component